MLLLLNSSAHEPMTGKTTGWSLDIFVCQDINPSGIKNPGTYIHITQKKPCLNQRPYRVNFPHLIPVWLIVTSHTLSRVKMILTREQWARTIHNKPPPRVAATEHRAGGRRRVSRFRTDSVAPNIFSW